MALLGKPHSRMNNKGLKLPARSRAVPNFSHQMAGVGGRRSPASPRMPLRGWGESKLLLPTPAATSYPFSSCKLKLLSRRKVLDVTTIRLKNGYRKLWRDYVEKCDFSVCFYCQQ